MIPRHAYTPSKPGDPNAKLKPDVEKAMKTPAAKRTKEQCALLVCKFLIQGKCPNNPCYYKHDMALVRAARKAQGRNPDTGEKVKGQKPRSKTRSGSRKSDKSDKSEGGGGQ